MYRDRFSRLELIRGPWDLRRGHAVAFRRKHGLYYHWAIFIGVERPKVRVIHYKKLNGSKLNGVIDEESIEDFCSGDPVYRLNFDQVSPNVSLEQVVKRANKLRGKKGYRLLFRNCQHMVQYCYGFQEPTSFVYLGLMVIYVAIGGLLVWGINQLNDM